MDIKDYVLPSSALLQPSLQQCQKCTLALCFLVFVVPGQALLQSSSRRQEPPSHQQPRGHHSQIPSHRQPGSQGSYRYDALKGQGSCASCNRTEQRYSWQRTTLCDARTSLLGGFLLRTSSCYHPVPTNTLFLLLPSSW